MVEQKEIQGTETGKQELGKEGSEKGMKVFDDGEGKRGKRMEKDEKSLFLIPKAKAQS